MKTEAEIRKHRDALRLLQLVPCGCAETEHHANCKRGGELMFAAERELTWVLGDGEDIYDAYHRQLNRVAADILSGN